MATYAKNPLKFAILDALDSIKDEWNELYQKSGCASHYLTFEFISLWYSCFATPEQIRIYQIVEEGETVGFLPLILKTRGGIRVLSSLTNYHCMHSGPLVRKGSEVVFQSLLLSELYRGWPDWDLLKLEYSNDFDRLPILFSPELLHANGCRWRSNSEPSYTVRLDLSFKEYFAELSAKVRKNYNNMKSRYDRSVTWSVMLYQGSEAIDHWDTFLELENSGWKGEGGSSIKNIPENFKRFYNGLLCQLAKRGALIVSLLWYDGAPISSAFMYCEGSILHMFKAGYDKNFHSQSPSNILFIETVRILCEAPNGLTLLNMFPGDFGYKHKIMQQEHQCHTTLLYRRTLRGRFLYRYSQLKTLVKILLKRGTQ